MIDLKIDKRDVDKLMRKLKNIDISKRPKILLQGLKRAAIMVERKLKANVSGRILKRRTGHLAKSIQNKVIVQDKNISAVIGSGVRTGKRLPYANIHETGGAITPKNVRFLTIPLKENLTPAGTARFTARELFEDYPGDVFIGKGVIFLKKRGNKVSPMFALKKSVRIPQRRYLSRTVEQMRKRVISVLKGSIERGLSQ